MLAGRDSAERDSFFWLAWLKIRARPERLEPICGQRIFLAKGQKCPLRAAQQLVQHGRCRRAFPSSHACLLSGDSGSTVGRLRFDADDGSQRRAVLGRWALCPNQPFCRGSLSRVYALCSLRGRQLVQGFALKRMSSAGSARAARLIRRKHCPLVMLAGGKQMRDELRNGQCRINRFRAAAAVRTAEIALGYQSE